MEVVLERLEKTKSNAEFLASMQLNSKDESGMMKDEAFATD
jgi:hypothetical protein